jgi:hypothetical protein
MKGIIMSNETKTAVAVEENATPTGVDKDAVLKIGKALAKQVLITAAVVVTTQVVVKLINRNKTVEETPEA